jgi:hypothetical protein
MIPTSPKMKLRRKQAAEALSAAGYPVTEATLNTKASRGGGPPYKVFGRFPLYEWGDLLAWAESQMSPLRRTTSEGPPRRAAKAEATSTAGA